MVLTLHDTTLNVEDFNKAVFKMGEHAKETGISVIEDMTASGESVRMFNLDISGWNTSKVTNMAGMFENANCPLDEDNNPFEDDVVYSD